MRIVKSSTGRRKVSWARISQIMNVLFLAPDIQKAIIDGDVGEVQTERRVREIARRLLWSEQVGGYLVLG